MKKLTALLIACFMAVCMASCSQKSDGGSSTDSTAQVTTAGEAEMTVPADAEKVLKEFAESSVSGEVEKMITCMYPAEMIDGMEKAGIKQEFAAAMSSGVGGELKKFSTDSCKKLSGEALEAAKKYFDSFALGLQIPTSGYKISDGYSLNVNIEIEVSGEASEFTDPVSVVLIEGEGWKLIPASEEYLLSMTQEQATEQASSDTEQAAAETEQTSADTEQTSTQD